MNYDIWNQALGSSVLQRFTHFMFYAVSVLHICVLRNVSHISCFFSSLLFACPPLPRFTFCSIHALRVCALTSPFFIFTLSMFLTQCIYTVHVLYCRRLKSLRFESTFYDYRFYEATFYAVHIWPRLCCMQSVLLVQVLNSPRLTSSRFCGLQCAAGFIKTAQLYSIVVSMPEIVATRGFFALEAVPLSHFQGW